MNELEYIQAMGQGSLCGADNNAFATVLCDSRSSYGIVAALKAGADIILCGRVADASPFIGLAAWAYGWSRDNFDALAGAFVAGHIGECVSAYCVKLPLPRSFVLSTDIPY